MILPGLLMAPCACPIRVTPVAAGLLAAPPRGMEWDFRLTINSLIIVALLLLGAMVIACVNRWRRHPSNDSLSPSDQLTHYRSLYKQGAISQEEFERLRALLSRRIRASVDMPAPSQAAPQADTRTVSEAGSPPDPAKPQILPAPPIRRKRASDRLESGESPCETFRRPVKSGTSSIQTYSGQTVLFRRLLPAPCHDTAFPLTDRSRPVVRWDC